MRTLKEPLYIWDGVNDTYVMLNDEKATAENSDPRSDWQRGYDDGFAEGFTQGYESATLKILKAVLNGNS